MAQVQGEAMADGPARNGQQQGVASLASLAGKVGWSRRASAGP